MLNKVGAIKTIFAGKRALSEVKGLKIILFKGVILNYLIFFCLIFLLNTFFFIIVSPLIDWLYGFGNESWESLVKIFKWTINISFSAIIALISIRFSIEFLSFWNNSLVNTIKRNFRKINEKEFSFRNFLNEIKYFLVEGIKLCFYPIILFVISLIPLIGLSIIFLLESQYFGKQCILVYLENLNDNDEIEIIKKKFRFLPIKIGWLPTILSFIPFVGWVLLPLTFTFQLIGFPFLAEKYRNT